MKVIDLLNKIANGKEVPKKIMVDNDIYEWDAIGDFYSYENENEKDLLELLSIKYDTPNLLKTEIELIEDSTIDDIEELWGNCVGDSNQCRDDFMLKNRAKINELVRKYNKLNKEIKELKEKK